MKRLLIIFSVFLLNLSSSFMIASCEPNPINHFNDAFDTEQDINIINKIKKKLNQSFKKWWEKKAVIDINDYPDQKLSFSELVTELKGNNDGLPLTVETIKKYYFLSQLFTAFMVEFNKSNQNLQDTYSNYYINTMSLSLAKQDIHFQLYHVNFDGLSKLDGLTNLDGGFDHEAEALTFYFDIKYEIQFKELQFFDHINGLVVITNKLDVISNLQDKLEKFFITLVDDVFKKQDYQVIAPGVINYNKISSFDMIWELITKELRAKNILFHDRIRHIDNNLQGTFTLLSNFKKEDSILMWAGEGYNPKEITVEKFLEFYKKKYNIKINDNGNYVRDIIPSFDPGNLTIENLPFKYHFDWIYFNKPINILMLKDKMEQDLTEFAKMTMNFWKYYKIETYNNKYKIVFNMKQSEFEQIVKKSLIFEEQKINNYNLIPIFTLIFNFFKKTLDVKNMLTTRIEYYWNNNIQFNLIKNEKSFIIEIFWKKNNNSYHYYDINFSYKDFGYSFFINPNDNQKNIHHEEFTFLQAIEFKVG